MNIYQQLQTSNLSMDQIKRVKQAVSHYMESIEVTIKVLDSEFNHLTSVLELYGSGPGLELVDLQGLNERLHYVDEKRKNMHSLLSEMQEIEKLWENFINSIV